MNVAHAILPLHAGAMSAMDMLVGLGPVLLGGLLIGIFILMLSVDLSRGSKYHSGYRDERPTGARLLFSGKYYELEELLQHNYDESTRTAAASSGSDQADGR